LSEVNEIIKRYERRKNLPADKYSPLLPYVYLGEQEKERAFIRWINYAGLTPLGNKNLLEVGCGSGGNLLQFIRLGFRPENIIGNELLTERILEGRRRLPSEVKIIEGNALELKLEEKSFDVVFQSMVFSSILDAGFQKELALKMWEFVKPGGGILWYDFIYNNPQNRDVIGMPFKRVKELFPEGEIKKWKITLAPPLSRVITRISPSLYSIFNLFPFLRTHILCWITRIK
jgi:ubiquinone/menaquinone biosynthesis C-methylase UbiE